MENASKALIIAGAILVSILIVSLGVLIFNNFSESAKDMANMDKEEIAAFNSKITPYLKRTHMRKTGTGPAWQIVNPARWRKTKIYQSRSL